MRMFPYSPINDSAAELYDVRCTFDEEHHEWIYVISIPEKDMAAQWLKGENNRELMENNRYDQKDAEHRY